MRALSYTVSLVLLGLFQTAGGAVELASGTNLTTDLRFRTQMVKEEDKADRHLQRIRGRLGVEGQVNEKVLLGARLATSQGNKATSTNTDLGGTDSEGMEKHTIWVDKFFFAWSANENLKVTGGKFEQPFFRPNNDEMIFDSDVTPEGLAVNYSCKCSEDLNWWVTASGQWIDEVHGTLPTSLGGGEAYADATLGGAQAGVTATMAGAKWTIGAAKYDFNNLGNTTALGTLPSTEGYKLTNAFLEVGFEAGSMPMKVYADYVTNSEADDDNTATTVGIKLNKAKEPGQWELDVWQRTAKPNAVVNHIADGDVSYNDVEATRVVLNYLMAVNSNVKLSYITSTRDASTATDTSYDVGQVDFEFKF